MSDELDDHIGTTLRRVAAALGVPVTALFADRQSASPVPVSTQATQAEVGALLDAFLSLADPRARRRCIATVEAESQCAREAESSGLNPDDAGDG